MIDVVGYSVEDNSDIEKSVVDVAKKHFKGTIDFKKGCKKSKGNENEYCSYFYY